MMKSPKTTIAGIIAILSALLTAAKYLTDGDPTTNVDYGMLVSAIMAGVAAIFARDNNVSSEAAGAK